MKTIDLSGKTAIVTGSTSGIGFAIAKGLAEAGAAVVINGRTAPKVEEARQRPRHAELLGARRQRDRLDAVWHELGTPRHGRDAEQVACRRGKAAE